MGGKRLMHKLIRYACFSALMILLSPAAQSEQYLTVDLIEVDRSLYDQGFICFCCDCVNDPSQFMILSSLDSNFRFESDETVISSRNNLKDPSINSNAIENTDSILDWIGTYSHKISYAPDLSGRELLLSQELSDNLTFTYGLSYLHLSEDFNWSFVDEVNEIGELSSLNDSINYHVTTSNKMFGAVVGIEGFLRELGPRTTITYGVKGGTVY